LPVAADEVSELGLVKSLKGTVLSEKNKTPVAFFLVQKLHSVLKIAVVVD